MDVALPVAGRGVGSLTMARRKMSRGFIVTAYPFQGCNEI